MDKIKQREILVVDDNTLNLQLLGNILTKNNYKVITCRNGKSALDYLKTETPDLILLDVMMEEIDGFEVCKIIKKNPITKRIPVIFLTAKTNPEDIVKGFEIGGADYVKKPFNTAVLLARIKTHLEMKILRGLLPICTNCKKVRDEKGFWTQIENYLSSRTDAMFTHSLCEDCTKELYKDEPWISKLKF